MLKNNYLAGENLQEDDWNTLATTVLPNETYTLEGGNYSSKLSVKGETKDNGDNTKMALTALDSDGRAVMNIDCSGRQNLFNYNANGAVSVLYNLFNPNSTQNIVAGHFAFGAKNSAGSFNTICTILSQTTDRTANAMSSSLTLSYMDGVDTTTGYKQPNKSITISKFGFVLPSIEMYGITNLACNFLTAAENISAKNIAATLGLTAGSLTISNGGNLFGNFAFGRFGTRLGMKVDIEGVFGINNSGADIDGIGLYIYANEHTAAKATSIQGANTALNIFKHILLNALGGNVGVGITTEPTEKLHVNGGVKATQYKLNNLNTAPASATDTGTTGEIRYTNDFIYVCVATNTWKRSALTTW